MIEDFFRREVTPSDESLRLGAVLIMPPLSTSLLTALAGIALLGAVLTLGFGKYTRHATLDGVLIPPQGVVKLYPPQTGQLRSISVKGGERVHKGQVMLVFDTEHQSGSGAPVEAEIQRGLADKLQSLHRDLDDTTSAQASEMASLQRAVSTQTTIQAELQAQIALLKRRLDSSSASVERFEQLRETGFVTEQLAQDKRDAETEQRVRLQGAVREQTAALQESERIRNELATAPSKNQVALDQIRREIVTTQSELAQRGADQQWSLTSPCDCVVSSIDIGLGQTATPNYPLLALVPENGELQAVLHARSRELGFLAAGQRVDIKLDAFPFEKFGAVEGYIESIANTPLSAEEQSENSHLTVQTPEGPKEPTYSIHVRLPRSTIDAYGKPQALHAGMQLSANVRLETRPLYEWLVLPLFETVAR